MKYLLLALFSFMISSAQEVQLTETVQKESSPKLLEKSNNNQKSTPAKSVISKVITPIYKAIQGKGMTFSYNNLPNHAAVKIKFKVHFVGSWDGTGFAEWGPDRFIATVDNKMYLLDATFNNCHILWGGNMWQSFPDPHQYEQQGEKGRKHFLYHGGEGAVAISSLGFAWKNSKSVDSSYVFDFIVKHNSPQLDLTFFTKWVEEDNSLSTYWIENLEIMPIRTLEKLSSKKEEEAWMSFFYSDGHQAQKAWSEVYAAHPEKFVKRVQSLIKPDANYLQQLVNKLSKGEIPTRALQKEIFINPNRKDARQVMNRILTMRELALAADRWATPVGVFWDKLETNSTTRAIRKAAASNRWQSDLLKQISLRLCSYLRMINTYESIALAKNLTSHDPNLAKNPFLGEWQEKNAIFRFTIKQRGKAVSCDGLKGSWQFIKNDLIVTWKSGDSMRISLTNNKSSSAVLNEHRPQEAQKKQFIKLAKP